MTNNELMKILKDENLTEKEKFYLLRSFKIGQSSKRLQEREISIRKYILRGLEGDGFKVEDLGTQYLATLITLFYHERKLYREKFEENPLYWDLSDENNEHFKMLGVNSEEVINKIKEAIAKNKIEDGSMDEIVYDMADAAIYHHNRDEKRVRYLKDINY